MGTVKQYITDKKGNTLSVIIPIEEYNKMTEIVENYNYEEDNITEEDILAIAESKEQFKRGEYITGEEFMKRLDAKYTP